MHPTALRDQLDAASDHAATVLRDAARVGMGCYSPTVLADDPWLRQQADALITALRTGTARPCPHIGPAPHVAHAVVWQPGRLVCPACAHTLAPTPTEDTTCDQCRRPAQHVRAAVIAVGPVLLGYGRCDDCADRAAEPCAGNAPRALRRRPQRPSKRRRR